MIRLSGQIVLLGIVLFLVGPFCIIVVAGLNSGDVLAFPPVGFSLRWILAVFQVESFRASFGVRPSCAQRTP